MWERKSEWWGMGGARKGEGVQNPFVSPHPAGQYSHAVERLVLSCMREHAAPAPKCPASYPGTAPLPWARGQLFSCVALPVCAWVHAGRKRANPPCRQSLGEGMRLAQIHSLGHRVLVWVCPCKCPRLNSFKPRRRHAIPSALRAGLGV